MSSLIVTWRKKIDTRDLTSGIQCSEQRSRVESENHVVALKTNGAVAFLALVAVVSYVETHQGSGEYVRALGLSSCCTSRSRLFFLHIFAVVFILNSLADENGLQRQCSFLWEDVSMLMCSNKVPCYLKTLLFPQMFVSIWHCFWFIFVEWMWVPAAWL